MSSTPQAADTPTPVPVLPFPGLAALLSLVIPGLGQMAQGLASGRPQRLIKGILFCVVLLGMFMYGQWLGDWRNVYVPHFQEYLIESREGLAYRLWPTNRVMPPFLGNLRTRLQYVAQFWIGAAAWPALWNYFQPDRPIFGSYQLSPGSMRSDEVRGREAVVQAADQEESDRQFRSDRSQDIAWIYTVIAGILNLLVIYDAWAGPVRLAPAPKSAPR
ncbi:MAG TPA: hypothetical protein PKD86_06295 [Gemmatales bacterium]|nr:hypothetical protein [Gemmatales bacterium]HMP58946.1 hypothetical protein [Gemmatales bacterium]